MKFQLLTEYYPPFLWNFYKENSNYRSLTYSQLLELLLNELFADTGAIHHYIQQSGNQSQLIISNCEPLQKKWAIENNVQFTNQNWKMEIALAQVKMYKPDVFYIESVFEYFGDFISQVKPYCKLIVSWISTPFSSNLPLNGIDLFLSSTPKFIEGFKQKGFKAEYMLPAFDERVLERIKNFDKKDIPFSFVGGWSNVHLKRKEALKTLVQKTPIKLWGYGYKKSFPKRNWAYFKNMLFPENKEILKAYQGEAWGLKMLEIIQRSVITFNIHESLLEGNVGNMRMFEASGVGTLILNDYGHNLSDLFEVGKEIESYKTIEEAVEKANYYISNPARAIEMGKNAQRKTLTQYNYTNYVSNLLNYCKSNLK